MEAGARTDRLRSLTVSPSAFAWFAYAALGALFLIVVSGATVRLTGSGLGCENWPRCGETLLPPKDYNAYVEFGNRVMGFAVGITTLIAAGAAFRVPGLPRWLLRSAVALPFTATAFHWSKAHDEMLVELVHGSSYRIDNLAGQYLAGPSRQHRSASVDLPSSTAAASPRDPYVETTSG